MKVDPEKFALAVVASSASSMPVEEKLELYNKSWELAKEQNSDTVQTVRVGYVKGGV